MFDAANAVLSRLKSCNAVISPLLVVVCVPFWPRFEKRGIFFWLSMGVMVVFWVCLQVAFKQGEAETENPLPQMGRGLGIR